MKEGYKISIIGITGKISSGKSTVAGFIEETCDNAVILDVDSIAKCLYEKYPEIKNELKSAFGKDVIKNDGTVYFGMLSRIVFSNKKELFKLNRIMFPRIRTEVKNAVKTNKDSGYIVIDAAILFGAKLDILCDFIILVESNEKNRKNFLKNKKISDNEIELKVKGQHIDINENCVDYIIINDGDMKNLLRETIKIMEEIGSREKLKCSRKGSD
jgi:dephospho-CoA kinase